MADRASGHDQSSEATRQFFGHSAGKRVNTDAVIAKALKKQYPSLSLSIAPIFSANLIAYASAGHARLTPLDDEESDDLPSSLLWKGYLPPSRRIDGHPGALGQQVSFGKFAYKWQGTDYILYIVNGRDGGNSYPEVINQYVLTAEPHKADALIMAAGQWGNELHGEVFVFDGGMWQKSAELYNSVVKSSWDNVILDADMKKALIDDHTSFFESRATYERLKVPWKRGIIYYGPPGNGKTISIKATMHMLNDRENPIPSLYVRNLVSWMGPEYAIQLIFNKARQYAPCYLIFEDLDSLITDDVRSYFLNEVDGLKQNDGVFMIGSTNHLERLDPGISKRPSRFDRKYFFPNPDFDQRVAYCHFWQRKLADNKDIVFPDSLCKAIADITDDFSFAYIQEAFVAALLIIARDSDAKSKGKSVLDAGAIDDGWVDVEPLTAEDSDGYESGNDEDLDKLVLWVEIKKQVAILREGLDKEEHSGETPCLD